MREDRTERIEVRGEVVAETDKALLLKIDWVDGISVDDDPEWFPRSRVTVDPDDDDDVFWIERWLLEDRGLL